MSKHASRPLPESLGLPRTGVDSHAHLDSEELWPDFEGVLTRAARAGVARIGQVFLGHAAYAARREHMGARPELFFILGVHPSDGLELRGREAEEWKALALDFEADPRLRAVGEIGLDYHWPDCPPETQKRIFRAQLGLARELDRPVVIHSRDAFADTLDILDDEGFAGRPLLWHCFGGDSAAAGAILERGWHISVPGPVSYPANSALREALRRIPAGRLLLETDCPYLAPVPWRGTRNEPALAAFTAQVLAAERGEDPAGLWTRCGRNALRFFGLETEDGGPSREGRAEQDPC
ncbi:MAG: TatD family hydrolase [Desulfovibrionaceae bacterium]|nr:TatD family hydrolase [Desulfovibrionaceae bacterium]